MDVGCVRLDVALGTVAGSAGPGQDAQIVDVDSVHRHGRKCDSYAVFGKVNLSVQAGNGDSLEAGCRKPTMGWRPLPVDGPSAAPGAHREVREGVGDWWRRWRVRRGRESQGSGGR